MKRPDIVRRIAEVVHRIAPDAKTILYGSEARGDAQVDSDIDLLILLDGDNLAPERELEITRHLYEVEVETGVIISPMVVLRRVGERSTTPFSINVMKEGIVLFMKEKLSVAYAYSQTEYTTSCASPSCGTSSFPSIASSTVSGTINSRSRFCFLHTSYGFSI